MTNSDPTLTCSFCGKPERDVRKLVAGPAVFICDECVAICHEIMEDDPKLRQQADERIDRLFLRAESDLEAAAVLLERGFGRQAIDVARSGTESALHAFLLHRDGSIPGHSFAYLLTLALRNDPDLRRLNDLRYTELITQVDLGVDVSDTDARYGFEAAARVIEFVRKRLGRPN